MFVNTLICNFLLNYISWYFLYIKKSIKIICQSCLRFIISNHLSRQLNNFYNRFSTHKSKTVVDIIHLLVRITNSLSLIFIHIHSIVCKFYSSIIREILSIAFILIYGILEYILFSCWILSIVSLSSHFKIQIYVINFRVQTQSDKLSIIYPQTRIQQNDRVLSNQENIYTTFCQNVIYPKTLTISLSFQLS